METAGKPVAAPAPHMVALVSNMKEVDRLSAIHAEVTTPGPGYKHAVGILHKSSIVLLVACWEAFVEDLAGASLEWMIDHAKDYKSFPDDVLERVASKHQGMKAWALADRGWQRALKEHLAEVLARTCGKLNTPKAEQVNELFLRVIGLPNLSSSWSWYGRSSTTSSTQLDRLVTLRASIAHRVKTTRTVKKSHVNEARDFIARLAVKTHNLVDSHLRSRTGSRPWGTWRFGNVT